jgi:hypothetical protein
MIAELALVLSLVTIHPVIYEGKLHHRPAIVHYSGKDFYVVYVNRSAWGINVLEVLRVDAKTFESEQLYVSEEIKA